MMLHLPKCSEEVVLPLVFAQKSTAEILEQESLRDKCYNYAKQMRDQYEEK